VQGDISAQDNKFYKVPAAKQVNMINNLKNGITSNNEGLRRSSIYFAGYYQVNELAGILSEQLYKSDDSKDRVIILMALYKIGGKDCYKTINDFISNSKDFEAAEIANIIVREYSSNDSTALSLESERPAAR
jgi:HEAT repeat protein